MGNCQRRRAQEDAWREADGWELLPAAAEAAEEQVHAAAAAQEEQEAQAAPLVAQLDAATPCGGCPRGGGQAAQRRPVTKLRWLPCAIASAAACTTSTC